MNLLILTSPEHKRFIADVCADNKLDSENVFVDWMGEEFIFLNNLTDWYDVGISFMYTHRVPRKQLSKPWYNFHPAPLPEFKGRNLCYHALASGAKEFGATIHRMNEKFDDGKIIEARRFPIEDSDDAESLSEKAIAESKELFKRYLPKILKAEVLFETPNVGGTYYKKSDPLIEEMQFNPDETFSRLVRAASYKDYHLRLKIGGVTYGVVKE